MNAKRMKSLRRAVRGRGDRSGFSIRPIWVLALTIMFGNAESFWFRVASATPKASGTSEVSDLSFLDAGGHVSGCYRRGGTARCMGEGPVGQEQVFGVLHVEIATNRYTPTLSQLRLKFPNVTVSNWLHPGVHQAAIIHFIKPNISFVRFFKP